jgi:hypothetical protein
LPTLRCFVASQDNTSPTVADAVAALTPFVAQQTGHNANLITIQNFDVQGGGKVVATALAAAPISGSNWAYVFVGVAE